MSSTTVTINENSKKTPKSVTQKSSNAARNKRQGKKSQRPEGPRAFKPTLRRSTPRRFEERAFRMPGRVTSNFQFSRDGSLARASTTGAVGPNGNRMGASPVQRIAGTLSLPGSEEPIRWPSAGFATDKTAIASTFQVVTNAASNPAVTTGETNYTMLATKANYPMAVFRDSLRAAVIYQANPLQGSDPSISLYQYQFYDEESGLSDTWIPAIGTTAPINPSYALSTTNWQPHGSFYPMGCAPGSEKRFTWMNQQDSLTVTYLGLTTSSAGTVTRYLFKDGQVSLFDSHLVSGDGTENFVFGSTSFADNFVPGYYALAEAWTADPPTTGSLELAIGNDCFAHLTLQNFFQNAGSIERTRIVAVAGMFTNTSQVLQLAGQVVGVQLHPTEMFYNQMQAQFSQLSGRKDMVQLDAREGMYGFMKPTDAEDFEYFTDFTWSADYACISDTRYPLIPRNDYLMFMSNINAADLTPYQGYASIYHHIEYETTDVWRDTGITMFNEKQALAACKILQGVTQFTKNPIHWSDIWSQIKSFGTKALNWVVDNAPKIATAASSVLPLLL